MENIQIYFYNFEDSKCLTCIPLKKKKDLFYRERERETHSEWACAQIHRRSWGRESSSLWSTEPNRKLHLTTYEVMTWAKTRSLTLNWLHHPGAPRMHSHFCIITENTQLWCLEMCPQLQRSFRLSAGYLRKRFCKFISGKNTDG